MTAENQHRKTLRPGRYLAILCIAALVAGCNSASQPVRKVANLEVQEAVGFTITEEVRISDRVRVEYLDALSHLYDGRLEQGITMLEAIAEAEPLVTAPRIDLGMAYRQQGDLEAAERNLLQALALNPDHPVAHNELGIVYRKTGRFKEAKQSYESAIAVFPGYHHARRNLAILCDLYMADYSCALEQYEAYMTTVPADAEASMWIADLRNRMDQ